MAQPFPKGPVGDGDELSTEVAVCWRGGGFSDQLAKDFFIPGKCYRAPMFLATSFRKEKAEGFVAMTAAHAFAGPKDALVL